MNRSSLLFSFLISIAGVQAHATVEVTSFTVNERDGTATATVSLSSSPGPGWLLDYTTVDGTAEDENGDNDYTSRSGTLSFAPDDTEEDVVIPITEDAKIEGEEQFSLEASNLRRLGDTLKSAATNGTSLEIVPETLASGTVTIEDNDLELFVNIEFVGGEETQAEVTLTCNSGNIDATGTSTNSKVADQADPNTASFEVINFGPAELLCAGSQTNAPPVGYEDTTGADCDNGFNQTSDSCLVQNTFVADDVLRNKSGRADVGVVHNIEIAGFIIAGEGEKCVVIRGRGPSVGVPEGTQRLANPTISLFSQFTLIAENDDWMDQADPDDLTAIQDLRLQPGSDRDAAIYECLQPGAYTAHLRGVDDGTGVGIVEVLDVDNAAPYLFNISARARVGTENLVTIGGFIISGEKTKQVLIRGRGPTVAVPEGVPRLADPTITLYSGFNTLEVNDDWGDAANAGDIAATGKAPSDASESAILTELEPGAYTVILRGVNDVTGTGIIEIFDLTGK